MSKIHVFYEGRPSIKEILKPFIKQEEKRIERIYQKYMAQYFMGHGCWYDDDDMHYDPYEDDVNDDDYRLYAEEEEDNRRSYSSFDEYYDEWDRKKSKKNGNKRGKRGRKKRYGDEDEDYSFDDVALYPSENDDEMEDTHFMRIYFYEDYQVKNQFIQFTDFNKFKKFLKSKKIHINTLDRSMFKSYSVLHCCVRPSNDEEELGQTKELVVDPQYSGMLWAAYDTSECQ